MRHIFIVNPAAGQGKLSGLDAEISAACEAAGAEYEIYRTKAAGDGAAFVREYCLREENRDGAREPLRFYACGGDGTLHEVAGGAAGHPFAEVACVPAGTGNDFIRNFPGRDFRDLSAQISGSAVPCDLIRYEEERVGPAGRGGGKISGYCVNMFNIGFDCNVVDMTARMKQVPLVSGTFAYLWSIAAMLIRKEGADITIEYEDGSRHEGKLLLASVANGAFCGGGIKGLPRAATDDGKMDISVVRDVPRRVFVRLFPKYMKGTHLSEPRLADVIRYTKEEKLVISPNGDTMKLCVDGEIIRTGPIRFKICPAAFRFVLPD